MAQTHPQAERWAAANLTRQGYRNYCPLVAVYRPDPVIASLRREHLEPMFRSYLFVWIGSLFWGPICHTRGVSRLLTAEGRPAFLPSGEVELLLERTSVRGVVDDVPPEEIKTTRRRYEQGRLAELIARWARAI